MSRSGSSRRSQDSNDNRRPDYSNPGELKHFVSSVFSEAIKDVKSRKGNPANIGEYDYNLIDMDPVRARRRQNAVLATMSEAKQHISPVCPEIPEIFYIEEEWASINSLYLPGYDLIESDEHILLGATLWLLDRIRDNGKMEDAVHLIPKDIWGKKDLYLDNPYIYDAGYSEEIILGVNYILRTRNEDCIGLDRNSADDAGGVSRIFMDDYTARKMQHQDVPSRQRYEALIALIRQEDKDAASKQYEKKVWEWVEIYFACLKPYIEKEKELSEKQERYRKKVSRTLSSFEAKISDLRKSTQAPKKSSLMFPLSRPEEQIRFSDNRNSRLNSSLESEIITAIDRLYEEEAQLNHEADMLERKKERNAVEMVEYSCYARKFLEQNIDPESAERISGFSISDPYEICFALLYLTDNDSDLPWLYYPGISLTVNTAALLPWHFGEFQIDSDSFWKNLSENEILDDEFHVGHESMPKTPQPPEPVNWYSPEYVSHYVQDGSINVEKFNMAQIVYQITGGIMPRNTHRYDNAVAIFKHFGITGKKVLASVYPSLSLLGEGQNQAVLQFYVQSEDQIKGRTDKKSISTGVSSNAEDTDEQNIQDLKEEIRQLKQALHDMTKEEKAVRKKLDEQDKLLQSERQELSDLRELVYKQAQKIDVSENEKQVISLPYNAIHRTVIIGGHDSWLKAIRPLLPDVKFFPPGTTPNSDLIRHADVVWIQPNSLSHKDYYKVIDIIRTNRIPIHYFAYASAEKCAIQLAEEDQNMLNR